MMIDLTNARSHATRRLQRRVDAARAQPRRRPLPQLGPCARRLARRARVGRLAVDDVRAVGHRGREQRVERRAAAVARRAEDEAERRVVESSLNKEYAGITGLAKYAKLAIKFALGADSPALQEGRVASVQTLSGTGACRVIGEFYSRFLGKGAPIYLPTPTTPWGGARSRACV